MKSIKVLGSGCKRCGVTADRIRDTAEALGVEIDLEKVEDLEEILSYGVMGTPCVVVDGIVLHTGGVPTVEKIENWIRSE